MDYKQTTCQAMNRKPDQVPFINRVNEISLYTNQLIPHMTNKFINLQTDEGSGCPSIPFENINLHAKVLCKQQIQQC